MIHTTEFFDERQIGYQFLMAFDEISLIDSLVWTFAIRGNRLKIIKMITDHVCVHHHSPKQ